MLQDLSNLQSRIDIVIPGNKTPAWFGKMSRGPSISTRLYPNWCNNEWMGFALFVCFRANSSSDLLRCLVSFADENLEVSKQCVTKGERSENIWIFFLPRDHIPSTWMHKSSKDIEFSFHAQTFNDDSCCGPCGVRLVYKKDGESFDWDLV